MSQYQPHEFLTVVEAAGFLRVSVSQVYHLIRNGELIALRVGHRGPWRIDRVVIEQFLATQYSAEEQAQHWRNAQFAGDNVFDF